MADPLFRAGTPVVVTRYYEERPSSGIGRDPGVAWQGEQWVVKEHIEGFWVRCWRTYDWFKGDEIIEGYEEADIPASCLEQIFGGERDDG